MRDGPGIWSYVPDNSHPGLRLSESEPRYTLSDSTVARPTCDEHGTDLKQVVDLPDLTLRDGHTLTVCDHRECFGSYSDGIDKRELQSKILNRWDEHSHHFEERNPPVEVDPHRDYRR